MTLSSSLNAGVAGLNVNSSKLGTIADNIANSQTNGYKRVDAEFSNLVLSEAAGTYAAGGVRVTSFRQVDARGSLESTSNATDIAIGGSGFLPVTPLASTDNADEDFPLQLITTGSFRPDEDGFLRTPNGLTLMGWPAEVDGTISEFPRDSASGLEPVRILSNQLAGSPTTEIELNVNLPAENTQAGQSGNTLPFSIEYFDNVGASQTLTMEFSPTIPATASSNEWTVQITDSLSTVNPVAAFVVQFDDSRASGGKILDVPAAGQTGGTYDPATGEFTFNVAGGPMSLQIGTINDPAGGMTQLSAEFQPAVSKNGAPVASLNNVAVDENGLLTATFEGGFVRTLFQIPLADFPNVNGLRALDNQAFEPSADSGALFLYDAGDGPTGPVIGFALEQSSAEIAAELTALIETQRAYSSNATVIQTVDEMLQETTNIKR
ncbi:MAG: flagellar hook-basal body complex protein [Pseudomonadota bacterium]